MNVGYVKCIHHRPEFCNSKDAWPLSREIYLAKAVWVVDLNSARIPLSQQQVSQQRVVNTDELGIAKIQSWSSAKENARKLFCIGSRNHEEIQISDEEISQISVNQAGPQIRTGLRSRLFGSKVMEYICSCPSLCLWSGLGITSAGSKLWFLRWHLSFYKPRIEDPNDLGTNPRLRLCLTTSTGKDERVIVTVPGVWDWRAGGSEWVRCFQSAMKLSRIIIIS